MVKLPDTRQLQRNQPQYTGQVMNVPVAQDSQGLASIAGAVGRMAGAGADYAIEQQNIDARRKQAEQGAIQARQDEIDKSSMLIVKSNIFNEAKILTDNLSRDPEYNKTPEKLEKGMQDIWERHTSPLSPNIKNDPVRMAYLKMQFDTTNTNSQLKIRDAQYKQQNDTVSASLFETSNQYVQNYAMLDDNEIQEATSNLSAMYQSAVGAGIITREQASKDIYEARTRAERNRLEVLPPEQIVQEFSGGKSFDFDQSVEHIFKSEGGYVAKDGRSNAPANFGINQNANPDIDVKNLTKDQAKEIYKERYWDKINADSLPENIRLVAFDTAVNQGVKTANRLIKESGGDLEKFTQLRIAEYKSLNQPENEKQWIDRATKAFEASKIKTNSILPQGELIGFYDKASKAVTEKQSKQQIDDIINTVTLKYPDSYEAQVAIVGGLDIPFDQRKKVMTILDSNKKRQEVIKRDNAEQLSYKAIEYINGGGLFENMPADMAIQLNASQRTYLQSYSDKANNKEGNKAKLKQSELLEYTKVTSLISDGDIDTLKKEYPPEKAVTLLNPKHYEQYLKAINPQQDAQTTPKATQQEENRRITAVFNNIGIAGQELEQGLFYDKYYDARESFINDNGRQPKGSEIQDILDGLVKERVVNKGYFSDTTKREFELTDKDIPIPSETEKESILSALLKKDPKRYWSDEDVQKVYNVMRGTK